MKRLLARLRYRFLADRARRSVLERLPGGIRIAARERRELFWTMAGAVRCQALFAAVESGAVAALGAGPRPQPDVLAGLDLAPEAGERLVRLMVSTGLVERIGGDLALTVRGLVVAGDPGIGAMVAHGRLLYADWVDPIAALERPGTGALARFWPYADEAGTGAAGDYARLMRESLHFVTDTLFSVVDFGRLARVLEIGGGEGALLCALARRHPHLALTLVELPQVAALARRRIAAEGLGDRVAVVDSDRGAVPGGQDCVLLTRLLHDLDDADAEAVLRRAAGALAPGGRVIVAEPLAKAGADPQTAYFTAYFIAMGAGRLRDGAAIARLARRAGLRPIRGAGASRDALAVLTFGRF